MSDETRTVTVESLAAIDGLIDALDERRRYLGWLNTVEALNVIRQYRAALAALPVATAGPEARWKFIATGLLSTMKGIARDRTVQTITNARKVAEAAIGRAEEQALRGAAAQADGGEARVPPDQFGDGVLGFSERAALGAQADGGEAAPGALCGAILNCALPTNHEGLHERDDGTGLELPTRLLRCEWPPNDGVAPGNARFDALLASIRESGIKEPLTINLNWFVIDGAHRLSIARHLGIERVPVRVWTGVEFVT